MQVKPANPDRAERLDSPESLVQIYRAAGLQGIQERPFVLDSESRR
jgi:hypothetical protein